MLPRATMYDSAYIVGPLFNNPGVYKFVGFRPSEPRATYIAAVLTKQAAIDTWRESSFAECNLHTIAPEELLVECHIRCGEIYGWNVGGAISQNGEWQWTEEPRTFESADDSLEHALQAAELLEWPRPIIVYRYDSISLV